MDVTNTVDREHQELDKLFKSYERIRRERRNGDGPTDRRQNILREIIRNLSAHAAAEEQVLYPVVASELPDGPRLANDARAEHQAVKEALDALARTPVEDAEFDRRLEAIVLDVRHHVAKEEGEIFEKLRGWLGRERLKALGDAFAAAQRFAPTRPHPMLPNKPPFNTLSAPAAAAVDRVLDVAQEGQNRVTAAAKAAFGSLREAAGERMRGMRRSARGAADTVEGVIEKGERQVRKIARDAGLATDRRAKKRSTGRSRSSKTASTASARRKRASASSGRARRAR